MNKIRKKALAWILATTALAVAFLAGSFIYLKCQHLTDVELIESRIQYIAKEREFSLKDARKEGYSDREIASYFAKISRAEFNERWLFILLAVGSIYGVSVLGIVASTLLYESRNNRTLRE